MKKVFLAMVFLLSAVSASRAAQAGQSRDFGAGVILGAPTGLSAKFWMTEVAAVDGALAWHFGDDDRLQLHVDHLWHMYFSGIQVPDAKLPLYAGLGLRVLAGHHSEAGLRIPLGVSYLSEHAPVEIFAELVPVMDFAPDTEADIEGGVGIRYYFK